MLYQESSVWVWKLLIEPVFQGGLGQTCCHPVPPQPDWHPGNRHPGHKCAIWWCGHSQTPGCAAVRGEDINQQQSFNTVWLKQDGCYFAVSYFFLTVTKQLHERSCPSVSLSDKYSYFYLEIPDFFRSDNIGKLTCQCYHCEKNQAFIGTSMKALARQCHFVHIALDHVIIWSQLMRDVTYITNSKSMELMMAAVMMMMIDDDDDDDWWRWRWWIDSSDAWDGIFQLWKVAGMVLTL